MGWIAFAFIAIVVVVIIVNYRKGHPKTKSVSKSSAGISAKEAALLNTVRIDAIKKEKEGGAKVVCSYCDCCVETDENGTCPNCGASLKDVIAEEKRKKAAVDLAMMQIEQDMAEDRKKDKNTLLLAKAAKFAVMPTPMGLLDLKKTGKK